MSLIIMESLEKLNDEVFIERRHVVRFDHRYIDFLKAASIKSSKGRARICMHKNPHEIIHEMLISISNKSYIRPHKHHNKSESFHLVEGEADIILFNEDGNISEVIPLAVNKNFYYRLDHSCFHTLLIKTPFLVIHEVTNGPFISGDAEFAKFSPMEDCLGSYMKEIKSNAQDWVRKNSV